MTKYRALGPPEATKEVRKPSPATGKGQKSKGSADGIDPTDGHEKKRQVFQSPASPAPHADN